jgi:lysine 2,3-aminomutase
MVPRTEENAMASHLELDKIAINVKSHRLLGQLLRENPDLEEIMRSARNETEALVGVRNWVLANASPEALKYCKSEHPGRRLFDSLTWRDYASIRILDYIDNAGREFQDLNLRGEIAISNPIKTIWLGVTHGTGGAKPYFFEDMIQLFRQLSGKMKRGKYTRTEVQDWLDRWSSGMDPRIIKLREENRERIINTLIDHLDSGHLSSTRFQFEPGLSREQKFLRMLEWWKDYRFHLHFAVRNPDLLNEMLGHSLDPDTMKVLYEAKEKGIPFFINPYYLSLLHVRVPYFAIGADLAIRYYVLYSQELVDEFGHIVAWEKEDQVEPGKPNAAGWLLPSHHNVHRRYPEVAILIPATIGRACGGLCASCQRMYDFQRGNLNFNLDKLKPESSWAAQLDKLMKYFEDDSQLRDVLITGGDGLMSSDRSLAKILEGIYQMAVNKRKANKKRKDGEKYAELLRIRIGSRLPVYLPQRITPELIAVLGDFKKKAAKIGIRQFVIQTHFESPMEITPEVSDAISSLLSAGWTVTNQQVFTVAASRRGQTIRLRQALNDIGVLTYYTFTVKGYMENHFNFVPNARAVQEQLEEKIIGKVPKKYLDELRTFPEKAEQMQANIARLKETSGLPFLATDRNVLNLPGVGKSLTFRVIGITRYGRRILEFDHDPTRRHSPIIHKMGKIVIIESKSIREYIDQLESIGEDGSEYEELYGYSIGATEPRMPLYEYPEYDFKVSEKMTNLEI